MYFVSFGSTIRPAEYYEKSARSFSFQMGKVIVSPPIVTEPEGMESKGLFLNGGFAVPFDDSKQELKHFLNGVETAFGRNRFDPESGVKDRQADLDIIGHKSNEKLKNDFSEAPFYQRVPVQILKKFFGAKPNIDLEKYEIAQFVIGNKQLKKDEPIELTPENFL